MYGEMNQRTPPTTGSEHAAPVSRIDRAKSEGMDHLEAQRQKVSANLEQFSSALRQTSQSLASSENQLAVNAVDWTSQKIESLAAYLASRDLAGMTDDARVFARRRPQLFLGGMFVAGVGVARYLRAGADRYLRAGADRVPSRSI